MDTSEKMKKGRRTAEPAQTELSDLIVKPIVRPKVMLSSTVPNCSNCHTPLKFNTWNNDKVQFVLTCPNWDCRLAYNPQGYILQDGEYSPGRFGKVVSEL